MKKIIVSLILTLIMLSACMGMVQAASATVSSSSSSPKIGAQITITVRFSQPVATASFNLNYDSSKVTYASNSIGGTNTGSSVKVDYIDINDLKTISSATFSFKTKASGSAKFSISGLTISDAEGNELSASAGSTTVNIQSNTPPPATNTQTGSSSSSSSGSTSSSSSSTSKPSSNTSKPASNSGSGSSTSKPEEKEPSFRSTNQKVYAKNTVNVRSTWSTASNSTILETLEKGESITRIGIGTEWDKVKRSNGQTAYVKSGYLTTTEPKEEEPEKNEETNTQTNEETNTQTNEVSNEIGNEINNNETGNEVSNEATNNEIANNEQTSNSEVGNNEQNITGTAEKNNTAAYVLCAVIGIIVVAIIAIIVIEIYNNKKRNNIKFKNIDIKKK